MTTKRAGRWVSAQEQADLADAVAENGRMTRLLAGHVEQLVARFEELDSLLGQLEELGRRGRLIVPKQHPQPSPPVQ